MASWTRVGSARIGVSSFYGQELHVDYATITRVDNKVKMWILDNYDKSLQFPYHSVKEQLEFDCQKAMYRKLAELLYFEQMGHGRPFADNSYPDADWHKVFPNSTTEIYRGEACRKE